MSLSTHVLDTVLGEPAAAVPVALLNRRPEGWVRVAAGTTDADGRLRDWVPADVWDAGRYRLIFDTGAYQGENAFFPEVVITFQVSWPGRPLHIPVLLSRYGFTTYRGS
jgi:5-hydroxyisourate hydrolase